MSILGLMLHMSVIKITSSNDKAVGVTSWQVLLGGCGRNSKLETQKKELSKNLTPFRGLDGTRTRDLLRDRQAF